MEVDLMKKKKIKYIVLLITATVILIADLVILTMSGRAMSAMPGGNREFSQNGEMFEMPDGFDPENMPESFGGGEMPEGFDPENMPEGFGGEKMPGNRGQNLSSIISKVRIACIVVAILCTLTDIFCVLKLIRLRKEERNKKEQEQGADSHETKTPDCPIDPVEERLKKQKRKKIKWIIIASILLILVILLQILSGGKENTSSSTVKEEVISSMVENGTIEQTIKGSGVLETASDVKVTVPGKISVTGYLVSNGDFVEEGEPIAVVEKKSVLAAISDIQDVIDEVDDAMEDAKEESITSIIKAATDGTVVAVYVKKGEKVLDIMYDKEALILLSLDDLLAIEIENPGNVNVGDKFTIKDADGNSATGKVAQVEKDTIIVTVSLSKFSYQEEVTVTDSENKELGSGKLYIYSQQKVTGFSGTISSVKVSKDDTVTAGETLLTLTDTDYTAVYQNLLNKRIALEEQYNRLVEIGNSGYVFADEAGTVSGIDDTLVVSAEIDSVSQDVAAAEISDNVTASTDTSDNVTAIADTMAVMTSHRSSGTGGFLLASTTKNNGFVMVASSNQGTSDSFTSQPSTEDMTESSTEDLAEGETEITLEETISKSVNFVWLNSDGSIITEGIPEKVTVQLCNGENVLDEQIINAEKEWKYTWTGMSKYGTDGQEIPYSIKVKETVEGYTVTTQTIESVTVLIFTKVSDKTPSSNDSSEGQQDSNEDQQVPNNGQQEEIPNGGQQDSNGNQQGEFPGGGQAGNMPSMNGAGSMSGTPNNSLGGNNSSQLLIGDITEEAETDYTFEETAICSLSPNDIVEIPITVDELDINQVKEGQKCTVTLDAFASQSFEGVIEDINYSGENSGGNTKYTVTVSMEKNADMLLGMNASVTIAVSSVSDILTIPVEALVEQDGGVYVYTEYNEKKDELGGLVEVTTGISDGQNAQILSGLDAEQEYYYRYADRITYTFVR